MPYFDFILLPYSIIVDWMDFLEKMDLLLPVDFMIHSVLLLWRWCVAAHVAG